MIDNNHIGKKTWKRLSPQQKHAIKKNRKNAHKLAKVFIQDRENRLGPLNSS